MTGARQNTTTPRPRRTRAARASEPPIAAAPEAATPSHATRASSRRRDDDAASATNAAGGDPEGEVLVDDTPARDSKAFGNQALEVPDDIEAEQGGFFGLLTTENPVAPTKSPSKRSSRAGSERAGRAPSEAASDASSTKAKGRATKAKGKQPAALPAIDEEDPLQRTAAEKGKGRAIYDANEDNTSDIYNSGEYGYPENLAGRARGHNLRQRSPVKQDKSSLPRLPEVTEDDDDDDEKDDDEDLSTRLGPSGLRNSRAASSRSASSHAEASNARRPRPATRRQQPRGYEGPSFSTRLRRKLGLSPNMEGVLVLTIGLLLISGLLSLLIKAAGYLPLESFPTSMESVKHSIPSLPELPSMPDFSSIFSRPDSGVISSQQAKLNLQRDKEIAQIVEDIDKIKKALPHVLAVDYEEGQYKIPDNFWAALQAKINEVYNGGAPWESFEKVNNDKVDAFFKNNAQTYTEDYVRNHLRLVSHDQFTDLLKTELGVIPSEFRAELDTFKHKFYTLEARIMDEILTKTSAEIKHQIHQQIPTKLTLDTLVGAHIARNNDIALRRVNFLAPDNRAVVDPFLSSPTYVVSGWFQRMLFGARANPPVGALTPWSEPGDCWCGSQVNPRRRSAYETKFDAKLQLAVHVAYALVPRRFTVEHIPRSGTMDKKSAPRHLELWAEINDPTALRAAKELSVRMFGGVDPDTDASLGLMGIPTNYVRIGDFTYDWAADNHVQMFRVPLGLDAVGAKTRKVIVRATGNYGAEHTCFYRLRLHGDAEGHVDPE